MIASRVEFQVEVFDGADRRPRKVIVAVDSVDAAAGLVAGGARLVFELATKPHNVALPRYAARGPFSTDSTWVSGHVVIALPIAPEVL